MKTILRNVMIVMGLMLAVSVSAQALAQEPTAQFQSTSTMIGSGSTLPQAAINSPIENAPSAARGPRRETEDDDFDGDFSEHGKNPYEDPIGEVPLGLLALLVGAYAIWRRRSRLA